MEYKYKKDDYVVLVRDNLIAKIRKIITWKVNPGYSVAYLKRKNLSEEFELKVLGVDEEDLREATEVERQYYEIMSAGLGIQGILRAQWTVNPTSQLKSVHGIDVETELVEVAANQLRKSIDDKIKKDLKGMNNEI